jgi:deoxyribodipyrimidine photo-lyase
MDLKIPVNIFWFRRDLRIDDNSGLFHALSSHNPVLPLFIFDTDILRDLDQDDARVTFIHQVLKKIDRQLKRFSSGLLIKKGSPLKVFRELLREFRVAEVFTNHDYEPYSIQRDNELDAFLKTRNIRFNTFKDHVIFEKDEVVKADGTPYTVYTPYMKKWLQLLGEIHLPVFPVSQRRERFFTGEIKPFPTLKDLGFKKSRTKVPPYCTDELRIRDYETTRDFPALDGTSRIGPHLRFGTVSIRKLVRQVNIPQQTYLKELIWREFFMQILYHFPHVITHSFKPDYDKIEWPNNEVLIDRWCRGETGYPLVDAGMRELSITGFMNNRVRMVTAGFLCKHLLTDWRRGEAWFAKKLLDYELSSNNGNWQWAAGSGCDAAPYFRIFNPMEQQKKFDPEMKYIKKWVPEVNTARYPQPIVDHKAARERAIRVYKSAFN